MSLGQRVSSDHQLARLLQIGVVLEEVVEARAHSHLESLSPDERAALDDSIEDLLEHAVEESEDHRKRLEALVDEMDAETVSYDEIEVLVREHYAQNQPEDFDGLLYDQLCNEETAYKFYDDLIEAIEASDATYSIERERVLSTLREIRAEEEAGVEDVTRVMEERK
ncbi:ferritin-like domain-containing protein [Natranaeroarchaeum aerophilus]|uniref:Ferritin-like domain-containing protein n=1 Tax=Natranaeroarchaeum aerophilus TaxID=2917711 RepID=A0AAE3K6L2_9EURY|nr:ferritin-like domain-containing protein [Natranaeroarchaeum aerophilus]MCL9815066.1 ferritin-like domain-containing protein [Natranaeroarchaeum aerophilus]